MFVDPLPLPPLLCLLKNERGDTKGLRERKGCQVVLIVKAKVGACDRIIYNLAYATMRENMKKSGI